MNEILKEKADFITENKNILIDNLSIVGYDLFSILCKDKKLEEIEEYDDLMEYIENKDSVMDYYIKDETTIINFLIYFVDKTCFDIKTKEKYKNNLYRYKSFFDKESTMIKRKELVITY